MSDQDTTLRAVVDGIFEKYDLDKSGTLSKDDTVTFYKELIASRADLGLTEGDYDGWFGKIDQDSDNTISKEELHGYLHGINYTQ